MVLAEGLAAGVAGRQGGAGVAWPKIWKVQGFIDLPSHNEREVLLVPRFAFNRHNPGPRSTVLFRNRGSMRFIK